MVHLVFRQAKFNFLRQHHLSKEGMRKCQLQAGPARREEKGGQALGGIWQQPFVFGNYFFLLEPFSTL